MMNQVCGEPIWESVPTLHTKLRSILTPLAEKSYGPAAES